MSLELQAPSQSIGFSHGAVLDRRSQTSDNSPPAKAKAKEKPYLGYRYVRQPNGRHIQVDLTEEDWIHPEVGDRRVSVEIHADTIFYLRDRFDRLFEAIGQGAVLPDVILAWNLLNLIPPMRNLQPDVTVFPELPLGFFSNRIPIYEVSPDHIPRLVIEVLSDSTVHLDRGPKKRHYERIGIHQLVLVDIRTKIYKPRVPLVQGFVLTEQPAPQAGLSRRTYIEQVADAHGRIPLLDMGLSLGVVNATAYLYDHSGQPLPYTRDELKQTQNQLTLAKARIEALEKLLSQQTSATTPGTQPKTKRGVKSKPSGH